MGGATKTIVQVVAVVAAVYAGPQIGAAIMETMGTTAAAAGVSEATVGAAAISGSTAAVNTAIKGGNIGDVLEAGAKGAITGAVGSTVGQAVGEAAGGGIPGGTAGGAASGATQALIAGQDPLKGAAVGGVTGGVGAGVRQGLTPDIPLPSGSTTDTGQGFDYAGGMTPEQVAAANPDLYPGGVVPEPGTETVFTPGGESYAQAATPIQGKPTEFAKTAGRLAGQVAGQELGSALYEQPSTSASTLTSTGLFTPTSIVPTALTGIAPTARGKPILGGEDEEAAGTWGSKTLRG